MMKRGVRIMIIAFISLTLISNYVNSVNWLISAAFGEDWYYYSTANQKFVIEEIPEKGLNLKRVSLSFEKYLKENPKTQDTILYRNFSRNPLKFWHWREYLFHKRYDYPYRNFNLE